ncbi:hypothetical protein [Methylobacterium sp. MA0201]|uniref:hypothetical protein n=1 Tax=Methylobacterium alsaeris TaxID=3344826 RepID=UPI0037579AA7
MAQEIKLTADDFVTAVNRLIAQSQREQGETASRGELTLDGTPDDYSDAAAAASNLASFAVVSYSPSPILESYQNVNDGTGQVSVHTLVVKAEIVGWRRDGSLSEASNPTRTSAVDLFGGSWTGGSSWPQALSV